MKKIIRLTEGDIHHMVRRAINEVLDGMDDTEKSYWLMRQRRERPNTKSRTKTNYVDNFRRKFYNDVYGIDTDKNSNPRGDYDYPESWDRNAYRSRGDNNIDVHGGIGIDGRGNLYAGQTTWGETINDRYTDPGIINRNFNYSQSPKEKNGKFYDNDDWPQIRKKDPSRVTMTPNFRDMFNKGVNRYNDLGDKYDRQRQSQQHR